MKLSEFRFHVVETCRPEATVRSAAAAMAESEIGSLLVSDRSGLVGIFTERDVVGAVAAGVDPDTASVEDWMSRSPEVFSPNATVREAAEWMVESGYRHMPLRTGGEIVGVLSMRDLFASLLEARSSTEA